MEEGLIALEQHARLDGNLFIQVEPRAVCAALPLIAILKDPFPLGHVEVDLCLHLAQ